MDSVIFALKYPDSEGNIWLRVSHAYDLVAGELAKQGVKGYIAYPTKTGSPAFTPTHLESVELDMQDYGDANARRIGQFLDEHGVRAVVFRDIPPTDVELSLYQQRGVRTVDYVVNSFSPDFRIPLVKQWANRVRGWLGWRHHGVYVPNSEDGYEVLTNRLKFPAGRVYMIKNGVDTDRFTPPEEGPSGDSHHIDPASLGLPVTDHYALIVSQARPEKRVEFLIDVAAEVFRRRPELSLTFVAVGDGGCRPGWEAKLDKLGLQDKFILAGRRDDPVPFYQLATVMLHAADRESFGNVTLEASSCGVPVICSDVGGPREIIAHNESGYLLPLDDLQGFADGIIEFIDDPQRRRAFGQAGRQRAIELFSLQREVRELTELLSDQVAQARRASS